jgi:hypothetical protein
MSVQETNGYLDVENATLRASRIEAVSNIGIANTAPQHAFSVGSNLYIDTESSNVLTVDGNVVCEGVKVGLIEIIPSYDLAAVSNVGNVTQSTIQFANATTSFVTTANATIGNILTVEGNASINGNLSVTSNAEVGTANLFVDTTTGRVGIGKTDPGAALDVVGDVEISSNLAVDTNTLFVDSVGNKVGIGTTNPKTALDINGDVAALSQQPPSNLTYNTATSSIAGHGDYVIDTSRNQFNSSSGNSTSAFDPMGNWWNSDSDYTSGDANISGTFSSLTDSDSTVHYGAWAALELPYTTKLRYVIASQRAHSTGPSSFPSVVKVFGASAIGGTLYLINTYSVPTASSYSGVEIPVNASSRYKAYYFSFPSLQGGSATVLQISRINLFTETIGIESSRFKATTGDFTGNVGIGTTNPVAPLQMTASGVLTNSLLHKYLGAGPASAACYVLLLQPTTVPKRLIGKIYGVRTATSLSNTFEADLIIGTGNNSTVDSSGLTFKFIGTESFYGKLVTLTYNSLTYIALGLYPSSERGMTGGIYFEGKTSHTDDLVFITNLGTLSNITDYTPTEADKTIFTGDVGIGTGNPGGIALIQTFSGSTPEGTFDNSNQVYLTTIGPGAGTILMYANLSGYHRTGSRCYTYAAGKNLSGGNMVVDLGVQSAQQSASGEFYPQIFVTPTGGATADVYIRSSGSEVGGTVVWKVAMYRM